MKTYSVDITVEKNLQILVHADSEEEADEIAQNTWFDCETIGSDFSSVSVNGANLLYEGK